MKVLFLDFDGVLNTGSYGIEPDKVLRLNSVVNQTNCYIVISSAWRLNHSLDELKGELERAGFYFSDRVIGMTPDYYDCPNRYARGVEIAAWLASPLGRRTKTFAIVDDTDYMATVKDRLVRTKFSIGLDEHAVQQLVDLLGE